MNAEWSIPFTLTTPYGTLPFNEAASSSLAALILDPQKCGVIAPIRVTTDNLSQQDGSLLHKEFVAGYQMKFGGWFMMAVDEPACDSDLRAIWDTLGLHLHALLGNDIPLDGDNSRITWEPTGADLRLLRNIRLLTEPQQSYEGGVTMFDFSIHSLYPFAISATERTEALEVIATNHGNAPAYPTFKIHGPVTNAITIGNATTGKGITYDPDLPGASNIGGGDYAEILTFQETIYLNGDEDNLRAGLDPITSDFFTLRPGANELTLSDTGVDVDVIWNDTWY